MAQLQSRHRRCPIPFRAPTRAGGLLGMEIWGGNTEAGLVDCSRKWWKLRDQKSHEKTWKHHATLGEITKNQIFVTLKIPPKLEIDQPLQLTSDNQTLKLQWKGII